MKNNGKERLFRLSRGTRNFLDLFACLLVLSALILALMYLGASAYEYLRGFIQP